MNRFVIGITFLEILIARKGMSLLEVLVVGKELKIASLSLTVVFAVIVMTIAKTFVNNWVW